ncbi:MAG: 23S rRNA (guanosine-2'-O-)-methyltransferase RlmB [Chlamydiia bacterium]|nr:23S rRNA (guanosine-2'-O-)-methyltransferase RlmB [Chlamydiia bacterium]MCH9616465.1 23S rRNA (guanosine-2'-O-)-methyltransferase RlmB [Chlamydiia bacterium]MCH9629549.1 23S rRNA (guanosine-2'-O-)-methyltransferase RlmB [Chlamydiia bacterium]
MLTREILSSQHSFIKHLVKLRNNARYRHENSSLLISGSKLVNELKPAVVIQEKKAHLSYTPSEQIFTTDAILKKITGQVSPDGIAGVVEMPKWDAVFDKKFLVAFDGIQDPGNLGTLIRSALALGFEGALLLPGTTDPFNDKVLNASKGAALTLPMQKVSFEEMHALPHKTYLADLNGQAPTPLDGPLILVLGSEGQGLSREAKGTRLTIQTRSVESLNVAVAGSILMHQIRGDQWATTT